MTSQGLWNLVLGLFWIVVAVILIVLLIEGLKTRRVTHAICTTAVPWQCTPEEFEQICSETAIENGDHSAEEIRALQNNCQWACDQLVSRVDMCQFTPCVYYPPVARKAFVQCK